MTDYDTDCNIAKALRAFYENIDIYSNSWGPPDTGYILKGPGDLAVKALEFGVTQVKI